MTFSLHSGDAENSRNRSNLAILPVTISRGRALAVICNNQQDTHDPLIRGGKRDAADARPQVCGAVTLRSYVPLARGRASAAYRFGRMAKGPCAFS